MKIDKLYLEVNNDEVEVGRSRLGFGFRSVSTLNERPVIRRPLQSVERVKPGTINQPTII